MLWNGVAKLKSDGSSWNLLKLLKKAVGKSYPGRI